MVYLFNIWFMVIAFDAIAVNISFIVHKLRLISFALSTQVSTTEDLIMQRL